MDIPRIALGTFLATDKEVVKNAIRVAVEEVGYRHLDCAAIYRNEDVVGEALQEVFARGAVKREDVWVTSKLWCTMHHPDDVEVACRKTLEDLKLDYLDLYLMHDAPALVKQPDGNMMPRDEQGRLIIDRSISFIETWKAMEKLVEKGLVKHIGVSNFTINMLERLRYAPDVKIQPYACQIELNLYMQQEPMRWYLKQRGIIFEGYGPLGMASEWRKGKGPVLLEDEELNAVAKELNKPAATVAIKFLQQLGEGNVCTLVKSTNPERIRSNFDINSFTLSDAQMERLKKRERCYRFADFRNGWGWDLLGDGW